MVFSTLFIQIFSLPQRVIPVEIFSQFASGISQPGLSLVLAKMAMAALALFRDTKLQSQIGNFHSI
jgi:hypothetical protein